MNDEQSKKDAHQGGQNQTADTIEGASQAIECYAFLDFEASSLSEKSWPIEIGLSWVENGKVQTWSSLIRPGAHWDCTNWSDQSAAVHNIKFAELEDAPCPVEVAANFLDRLGDRTPLSDAPDFETRWLGRLLSAAGYGKPFPAVQDYHTASFELFEGFALDMLYEALERRSAPHRAGPDSGRLAGAWLAAVQYSR